MRRNFKYFEADGKAIPDPLQQLHMLCVLGAPNKIQVSDSPGLSWQSEPGASRSCTPRRG